ncbi:MAG: nucleoside deaminase [Endomicrobiia bacterium]
MKNTSLYIKEAIKEAKKAYKKGEIPVGSLIVKDGRIISRGHNLVETLDDPTAHAEIVAIRYGAKKLKNWRLSGCTLYTTVEPCPMCYSAIEQARISKVVYGCKSNYYKLNRKSSFEKKTVGLKLQKKCGNLLKRFFKKLRDKASNAERISVNNDF